MASGVAALHREKMIHRDLKPHNNVHRVESNRIKIADLVIAKILSDKIELGAINGTNIQSAVGFNSM